MIHLGLIYTRHFDGQYCDKNIFLSHRYLKIKVSSSRNMNYLELWSVKSLPWLFNRNLWTEIKISFYRNITILCAKMYRVSKALNKSRIIFFLYRDKVSLVAFSILLTSLFLSNFNYLDLGYWNARR